MGGASSRIDRRPPPLSVHLSVEERRILSARAGAQPLSTYVKSRLFLDGGPALRSKARRVQTDEALAGQILAALGQASLSANLSALAQAAQSGSLIIDAETVQQLHAACADVAAMRAALMQALGKREGHEQSRLQQAFTSAAGREVAR